jgi:hypothetical protein
MIGRERANPVVLGELHLEQVEGNRDRTREKSGVEGEGKAKETPFDVQQRTARSSGTAYRTCEW